MAPPKISIIPAAVCTLVSLTLGSPLSSTAVTLAERDAAKSILCQMFLPNCAMQKDFFDISLDCSYRARMEFDMKNWGGQEESCGKGLIDNLSGKWDQHDLEYSLWICEPYGENNASARARIGVASNVFNVDDVPGWTQAGIQATNGLNISTTCLREYDAA